MKEILAKASDLEDLANELNTFPCKAIAQLSRSLKSVRSPVIHRVYVRIEKPTIDLIVYRGDRASCPEAKSGDHPIKALRSPYSQVLELRMRSLILSIAITPYVLTQNQAIVLGLPEYRATRCAHPDPLILSDSSSQPAL